MEFLLFVIPFGILIQLLLAYFTAEDAWTRGHHKTLWFGLVLLFGIPLVLVYLLRRNDERLHESERAPRRDRQRLLRCATYYGVAALLGVIVLSVIGGVVAQNVHPAPEKVDHCYEDTEELRNGESMDVVVCTNDAIEKNAANREERAQQFAKQASLEGLFSLFGLIGAPAALFLWNERGGESDGSPP